MKTAIVPRSGNRPKPFSRPKSPAPQKTSKPVLTIEALSDWLNKNEITLCYNVITHCTMVEGMDPIYTPNVLEEQMHIIIHDTLKSEYHCNKSDVRDMLSVIVHRTTNSCNPVDDMLLEVPKWDGVDRIAALYQIIGVASTDALSETLIRSWLYQTYAMAHNTERHAFGAEGILVLNGPQGIGKTTLCRVLGGNDSLVKTGLYLDAKNKDTIIRATSCWICELGEVETTLRTNAEWLKAFITAETDRYRVPYARSDVNHPRRTSYIATCNSDEFLVDESGSRRFWVIPLRRRFDLASLRSLDVRQLWRQVEYEIENSGKSYADCFRLSQATLAALQRRNCVYKTKLAAQNEIEDILFDAKEHPENYQWEWTTTTRFKERHPSLKRFTTYQIGRALKAIMGDDTRDMRLSGSTYPNKGCRYLPFAK